MNIETVYQQLDFRSDMLHPKDGQHDLHNLVAQVVARLPKDVQFWLLCETDHVFIGGSGQMAEFFELRRHPSEMKEGFINIRFIFLSERLANQPKDEVLWTIAHEIAHSRLNHGQGGYETEVEADRLMLTWGFPEPPGRAEEREVYKLL